MRTIMALSIAGVLLLLGFVSVPGCVTTKTPDGTTVTRVDTESTVAILQTSITLAEGALSQWAEMQNKMSQADFERGLSTRRANVEMLQALLGRELKKASVQ